MVVTWNFSGFERREEVIGLVLCTTLDPSNVF